MSDERFQQQREGCIIKRIEISKNMQIQGRYFCFNRPQLEVEIIKTLERDDLLRFYNHYISPHSIHRHKLSVHANPSTLALQIQTNETTEYKAEASIQKELSSIVNQENIVVTVENSHVTIQSTEQQPMSNKLIEKENNLTKQEINLPEIKLLLTYLFLLGGMD